MAILCDRVEDALDDEALCLSMSLHLDTKSARSSEVSYNRATHTHTSCWKKSHREYGDTGGATAEYRDATTTACTHTI